MKGRLYCFIVITIQMVSWVSATSRPFAPNDGLVGAHPPATGQSPESSPINFDTKMSSKEDMKKINVKEAYSKGLSRIGSSPPSCEHKCYGCIPCEAIQVPTTTKRSHMGIQYANYEPEGWKCKCGPSFYSP